MKLKLDKKHRKLCKEELKKYRDELLELEELERLLMLDLLKLHKRKEKQLLLKKEYMY